MSLNTDSGLNLTAKTMNKAKLFKNLVLLLIFFLSASSCKTWSNQPTQIRITDLSGNPVNVEVKTPEGNAQILEDLQNNSYSDPSQNITREAPVIEAKQNQIADNPVNKYVRMEGDKTQNPALQNANTQIANTKQNSNLVNQNNRFVPAETQSKEAAILENQAQITKEEQIKEQNSAKTNTTPTSVATTAAETAKTPAASDKIFVFKPIKEDSNLATPTKSGAKSGEIYVQLGLFSQIDNAKKALESAQNISSGEIKEEVVGGKNSYRALLGPFPSNTQAQEIIRQLSKSGKDSFIYKK